MITIRAGNNNIKSELFNEERNEKKKFHTDCVINLIGYRVSGHNVYIYRNEWKS